MNAIASSLAVETQIRDLIVGISPSDYGLPEPGLPFRWLTDAPQPSHETQAETWGQTRLCSLLVRGLATAPVAHSLGQYDEAAVLQISYEVGGRSQQVVYRQIRADGLALYRVLNQRFQTHLGPIQRLVAEPGQVLERPGVEGEPVSMLHQIPLQLRYLTN